MRSSIVLKGLAGFALLAGLVVAGVWFRGSVPAPSGEHGAGKPDSPAGESRQVKLTPQAQSNLRLLARPLKPDVFWRTIQVPGLIVDRPAQSDRGIVAPVTGVVTMVHHFPGDTVRSGDALFTLRLLSETLHLTQSDLFKTTREIQLNREQKKRLTSVAGSIPESRIIELDNQLQRLAVAVQAYRQELQTRGLTPAQIEGVAEGKFVSEIVVQAPRPVRKLIAEVPKNFATLPDSPHFEVQELKVELGQQVQAGQTLGLLSNHQLLYIEGRAFCQEIPLVERAAKEAWPLRVDFLEATEEGWPSLDQVFTIRHIANSIDPASRTVAFYLPFRNQSRSFAKDGKTLMLWRFRPGQKVRLHVQVEKFENVFVLPADAVAQEGPESYVFRQNGDLFDRLPVRVVHQDRQHAVIANDGSIPPGLFVAQNGATQLNRALKAQGGQPGGFHVHADGSVHANH